MLMKQKHVESVEAMMIQGCQGFIFPTLFIGFQEAQLLLDLFHAGKGAESSRNAGMEKY